MATVSRTLILKATDTNGEDVQRTISYGNPAATDKDIDDAMRALNGLSKNAYKDTLVQDVHSVTEALAD